MSTNQSQNMNEQHETDDSQQVHNGQNPYVETVSSHQGSDLDNEQDQDGLDEGQVESVQSGPIPPTCTTMFPDQSEHRSTDYEVAIERVLDHSVSRHDIDNADRIDDADRAPKNSDEDQDEVRVREFGNSGMRKFGKGK